MKLLAFVAAMMFTVTAYAEPPQKKAEKPEVKKVECPNKDCPQKQKLERGKHGPKAEAERSRRGPMMERKGRHGSSGSAMRHRGPHRGPGPMMHRRGHGGPRSPMMQGRGPQRGPRGDSSKGRSHKGSRR